MIRPSALGGIGKTHGHLMSRNEQPPTCSMRRPNTNNKTLPARLPPMKGQQKKYNIQGDFRVLLGMSCEVKEMMRFLKETDVLENIK